MYPTNEDAPDTVRLPSVVTPALKFPVMVMTSLPKLMSPDESVMDHIAKVRIPIDDTVATANVPVVVMFSSPKLMAPDECRYGSIGQC